MLKNRHFGASLGLFFAATLAVGQSGIGPITTSVANANPRSGHPDSVIASGYSLKSVAIGTDPLENPSGMITQFGYLNDFPPQLIEPTKSEADENLYLVFRQNPGGPTAGYDYGRHFLFQFHESPTNNSYVTRINLDVTDPAHRITLLTPPGSDGFTHLSSGDGSTYDPFTRTLVFTQETGFPNGSVIQVSTSWPPVVTRLDGVFGFSGYEGIHPDDRGNVLVIEDAGGTSVNVVPTDPNSPKSARQPPPRLRVQLPSSVPRTHSSCPAPGSVHSFSIPPATPTPIPAISRIWPSAAPGDPSSASTLTEAAMPGKSPPSFSAMRSTLPSTISPSPTTRRCWLPKTVATASTDNSIHWIRYGPSSSTARLPSASSRSVAILRLSRMPPSSMPALPGSKMRATTSPQACMCQPVALPQRACRGCSTTLSTHGLFSPASTARMKCGKS